MTTLDVQITKDAATPLFHELSAKLVDRTQLHKRIADKTEVLVRSHLLGLNRHQTASRLGATPTNYFERKANGLESRATANEAIVTIPTGNNADGESGLEAFARVLGPVQIAAKAAQWLTIPAIGAAYGRRAREFEGLFFKPLANGNAMLARRDGKRLVAFYWLKKSVTLSEDRTLLPTDEQFADAAEEGAEEFVMRDAVNA